MKKIVLSLIALSAFESALALDSGAQNLTDTVGATDYFKINCADDTDHLNFQLLENAVAEDSVEKPIEKPVINVELPQLFNAKLTKAKFTASVAKITASTNKEISLKGGAGSYTLSLNTVDTNLVLQNAQTYSIQYQCLDTANQVTPGSSTLTKLGIESKTKTLANNKTAKYVINCTRKTDYLKVTLFNKTPIIESKSSALVVETPASGNLMAQIVSDRREGFVALNTIGYVLDVKSGNGDYFVMVNSQTNTAKNYRFQYSCLNTSNVEAKTLPIQILQNQ